MPDIKYQSEDFPPGDRALAGIHDLKPTWGDLIWAAITVGRPNRYHVFRHGEASLYEALFRLSLIRMTLEEHGHRSVRFRKTTAAQTLDPSEKGAVSYFLGMAVCKLFATELLKTPWLLHLDVFRPTLNPVLRGRSRPDLIGQSDTGQWHSFESKGRASPPSDDEKDKAKFQAEQCRRVNGTRIICHVGAITYYKNDVLHFFWRDPPPDDEERNDKFDVEVVDSMWRHYYASTLALVQSELGSAQRASVKGIKVPVEIADIEIGIHPDVFRFLREQQWGEAKRWCESNAERLVADGYKPDGLLVVAGPSWSQPFSESEA